MTPDKCMILTAVYHIQNHHTYDEYVISFRFSEEVWHGEAGKQPICRLLRVIALVCYENGEIRIRKQ